MPRPDGSVPDRVVSAGIALAAAGVVVHTGIHLFNGWVLDYKWGVLNVTEDESVFGWASSAATFGAALAVVLFGFTRRSRMAGPIVLAAIISFLSLDDFLQLHERVASLWKPLGLWEKADRLVWPAIFMPLLAATFILALRLSAEAGTRISRLVRFGLILLVAAVALEIASEGLYHLGWDDPDLPLVIEAVTEEGAELAGWVLIATGFFAAACANLIAIGSSADGWQVPAGPLRSGESGRLERPSVR